MAHNEPAARVFADHLAARPSTGRTIAVVGILGDKDSESIAQLLRPLVSHWILCTIHDPRGLPAADLARRMKLSSTPGGTQVELAGSTEEGFAAAKSLAVPGDPSHRLRGFQHRRVGVALASRILSRRAFRALNAPTHIYSALDFPLFRLTSDVRVKERLTGAIILVALLVLLVPELLTGPESSTKVAGSEGRAASLLHHRSGRRCRCPPAAGDRACFTSVGTSRLRKRRPEVESGASSGEAATADPAGKRTEVPADEAAAASAPEPTRGSGADSSVAGPAVGTEAGSGASAEEPERPRSAFGPNAVGRAQTRASRPASAGSGQTKGEPAGQATKSSGGAASHPAEPAAPPPPRQSSGSAEARGPSSGAPASKGWAVQLGVFASRDNAERLAKQVKAKGFSVVVNETSGKGKPLYRVRVGPEGHS
ncbi:MAG: SPOR domain-containing protein [Gammaproteobacteria bacterium]